MPSWFASHSAKVGGIAGTLELYKKALKVRKEFVGVESIEWVEEHEGALRFKRGGWEVVINLEVKEGVECPKGKVVLASGELEGGKVPVDTTVWVKVG
jgi:alpha-glucosidase